MLTTLLAITVVAVSIALLFYLVTLLLNALSLPVGAWLERARLERYIARTRHGDRLLQDGTVDRALTEFAAAFYPHAAASSAAAAAIANHHTGMLSRLIAAADQLQGGTVRLLSLAKVDRLLHERTALQRRLLTLRQSGRGEALRSAETEFQENTAEIRAALAALTTEILTTRQKVVYH